MARREGVRISLGTDAHHAWQLEFTELGPAAARKARIPAARIINFLPLGENFVAGSWQGIDKLTALMLAGEKLIAFADRGERLQSTKSRPAIE
jgi:hypothetical protein